jgi:3-oxoadipate enol-lactonase
MPFANLPDVKIHYELAGAETFPVLMFSSSLGTNLSMWNGQLETFARYFRILRYDTRGHGQSDVLPGPYNMEQLSWDVLHLLDALKLDRVYFCGLSMGGTTGMFLGANAAKRFQKLVLCNTSAKFGPADAWNTRIEKVKAGGMKAVASMVLERWLTREYRSAHPEETQSVLAMLESANPEGYVASCAAVRDADMQKQLKNVAVPSLIVAGTFDPAATPAVGQQLAHAIPGASYVELTASHLSNVEAKDEFNRQVLQFLLA